MDDPKGWKCTPPLAEFRKAYDENDNIWWKIECGHHMNLFDEACDEIEALKAENEQLRAERAFLATRQIARATYAHERCWGLSSDWLAYSACGFDYPKREPSDPSDLMACWRTVQMAPPHVRERMLPQFNEWVEMICEKWPSSKGEIRAAFREDV